MGGAAAPRTIAIDRLALPLLDLTERFRREQTVTVPLSSAAATAGAAQPVSSYLRALLGLLARRTILPAFERFVVRRHRRHRRRRA